MAACQEDVQEVFVIDDGNTQERADDGDIVGPSQDWNLRLSPSQTQTQTQYSIAHREQVTRNILSQQAETHQTDLDAHLDDNKLEEKSTTADAAEIEEDGRVSLAEDPAKFEKPVTRRRLLSRQATPWHATPTSKDAGQSEDDAPIEILDSEEQLEDQNVPRDEDRVVSVEKATKDGDGKTTEPPKNAAIDVSEEGAGDSVFLEGVEPWSKERRRSGMFGESDDHSPIAGDYHFNNVFPFDSIYNLLKTLFNIVEAPFKKFLNFNVCVV